MFYSESQCHCCYNTNCNDRTTATISCHIIWLQSITCKHFILICSLLSSHIYL
jgi:hypothetical protein